MNYCRWLISSRLENVFYPAEDKHIHHFGGSFNAKLGYICHIRRGENTWSCEKIAKGGGGGALMNELFCLCPRVPVPLYSFILTKKMFFY